MRVVHGDLWDYWEKGHTVVVPTNLFVSPRGKAVLGRGVAKQASNKFPGLEFRYGKSVQGGTPLVFYQDIRLLMFPVKPARGEEGVPGFMAKADIHLIRDGVRRLKEKWHHGPVAMPAVGCGFGELQFKDVFPIINELPDHFTLVLRDETVFSKYRDSFRPGARIDRGL